MSVSDKFTERRRSHDKQFLLGGHGHGRGRLGMRMKSQERMIRRGIHRTARRMEQAFDTMMG